MALFFLKKVIKYVLYAIAFFLPEISISQTNVLKKQGTSDDNYISKLIQDARQSAQREVFIPAGTYLISKGFPLPDSIIIAGAGMGKTVLKLMDNLPPRRDEKTQTAIFTGEKAYSLSQAQATRKIVVKGLTIDLSAIPPGLASNNLPMLGGIRLVNPTGCRVDSVRIIQPPRFGIGLYATRSGTICDSNSISNCVIQLQDDWYEVKNDSLIRPKQQSLIGIELSSYHGEKNNGTATYISRNNPLYFLSKSRNNIISRNMVTGGSHGISLSNASENTLSDNSISGCSHRGIIIISTSDSNNITNNHISAVGSTGIHLAYGCDHNQIINNVVDTVFGIEGDGIKSYINCNFSLIKNNRVSHFDKNGIRVAHGANGNVIIGNRIMGDGKPNQIGIAIISNLKRQFGDGFSFGSKLTANQNICSDNDISQTGKGILINDEMRIEQSIKNNRIKENRFSGVKNP
jgi:parallel beta-helix repeat protein